MKLSEVFQVVKPQYVFLKLKPNNSIRNNSTHLVARTISSMYKNVFQSIVVEEKKLMRLLGKEFFLGTKYQFHVQGKVAYFVYIEKKKIEFYFIVPKQYESILTEKVGDVWNNVTIEEVGELPSFHEKATKYQLVYEKEDAMSLKVDRRDNDLLRSNLNIVDVLEEGDKVGIMYNFIPSSQESFKFSYKATVEKVKKGIPVERNKMGANYIFKMAIGIVDGLVKDVSEVLAGKKEQQAESSWLETLVDRLQGGRKLSEGTESKIRNQILPAQILILSESQDKLREINNGRSLANSFEIVSEDNRLVAKKLGGKVNLLKNNIGTEINKVSDQECQNFISLAGRELLEMHDCIEKVETHETLVPEDLQKGKVSIGESTYRGHKQTAYLTTDREYENLSLIIIGPNRAGKSTLIGNLTNDALNADECVVLFDFIENCELSSEVATLFDPEKVLVIDCSNDKKAEGLGYNEIKKSADTFEQYKNAKLQTSQLETLVNSINADESRLSPKMERYLQSAANVVFLVGGSIKDVFAVLQNHKARGMYLSKVPKEQYENLEEYIESLRELDERDKDGLIIGTKLHLVVGIIDRLNKLKANAFMELMLKKSTDQNIDLVEETQKAQLIIIKMPETMFPTDNEKDICSTYWMTKLWLAMQVRADKVRDKNKRRKVNFIIDELYQVKNTERFLTEKLSRLPKFRIKPIISCHYLNQIKTIREELRSANASYMLIAGCDKKNYDELKSELYPFTEEDLLRLPRYHSMNLIKSREGYGRFITKLPKPVRKKDQRMLNLSYEEGESRDE